MFATSGDGSQWEDGSSYEVSSHSGYDASGEDESLKGKLQKWLEGEQVDWSGEYAAQFAQAQQAAEALIRDDPERAEQTALQSEQWLADHLESDLELMKLARSKGNQHPVVADDKIQRVERMYHQLRERIQTRQRKLEPAYNHDEL
jgi:protein disulfide-isomerase A6